MLVVVGLKAAPPPPNRHGPTGMRARLGGETWQLLWYRWTRGYSRSLCLGAWWEVMPVTTLSTSVAWWVAAVAGVAGALVGTAMGIFSALWARSDTAKNEAREVQAARRAVADELGRL